jgi:hypothetical protein
MLISRVIEDGASDGEWSEWVSLAECDTKLWRQLAEAQRDHSALERAMDGATAAADTTVLPSPLVVRRADDHPRRARLNQLSAWSGWAVAALVALAASTRLSTLHPAPSTPLASPSQEASILPVRSTSDLFQAYLDKGRETGEVVGEVPGKLLIESRPIPAGQGFEIVFIRQVMERTVVPELYQVNGQNELGQPTLVRVELPRRGSL